MILVTWKDSTVTEGKTWDDVLRAVNALPWNEDLSEADLRIELAARAWAWNFTQVNPWASAEELFRALADAHIVEIGRR